jgi:glucarate dehydratase
MACWDIMGKATNQPVAQLLGGIERREIPVSAFVHNRESTDKKEISREQSAERIVEFAQQLIDKYGFKVIKYKSEGTNDLLDLKVMRSLREHFGEEMKLRIDPNTAWTYEQALNICKKLEPYDLEYIEDPVAGIEAMSRLRREVNIPFSTNMCVVDFDQLAIGIQTKAVDVILGDPPKWGGLWNCKKLAAVCETFKLGMSIHSGGDLGISTAAILQLVASTPVVHHAMDSLYYHYVGDIITEPFKFIDGCLHLPEGPGLGVEIDQEAFDHYATMHEKQSGKPLPKGHVYPM